MVSSDQHSASLQQNTFAACFSSAHQKQGTGWLVHDASSGAFLRFWLLLIGCLFLPCLRKLFCHVCKSSSWVAHVCLLQRSTPISPCCGREHAGSCCFKGSHKARPMEYFLRRLMSACFQESLLNCGRDCAVRMQQGRQWPASAPHCCAG